MFSDTWEEARELTRKHWEELGQVGLSSDDYLPDVHHYLEMEKAGALLIITARVSGELVGYASVSSCRLPHSVGKVIGMCDAIYLSPKVRGRSTAARDMLKEAEAQLLKKGINLMSIASNVRLDIGPFLRRSGYLESETIYTKQLGVN